MEEISKLKTSNVAAYLNAIKSYVNLDEALVTKVEQFLLKEKAQKATEHLSLLFSPEAGNVFIESCQPEDLPTDFIIK